MKNIVPKKIRKLLPALAGFFLLTCGIEDYPYIYPIPTGNITYTMNSRVRISIPNNNLGNMYFTNFTLFYRLYISDIYEQSPSETNLAAINSALSSDYSRVKPYIDNDSMQSSSISSLFSGMNYYTLNLETVNIDNILSSSSFSRTLTIDFPQTPGSVPFLTLGSTEYPLCRSDGGGSFEPLPDNLYLVNSPELRNPNNINSYINADITDKSAVTDRRYTYIAMYIVAAGFDHQTYVQLYSSPAFAGVLCLPD